MGDEQKSPVKAMEESTAPKSSPTKKEIDTATQALNHFAQGKRHMLVNDITSAVNSFQEACTLLSEQHGQTAPECGDAYFWYGKSLLEMARIESGVLGNALEGDEGSTEAEDSPATADEDEKDEEEEDEQQGEEGEEAEKAEPSPEGEKTEEEEGEDDVSNIQLSWEMLELAKVIFNKKEGVESRMKVAEICLKLGEVSMENENYAQAVDDIKECLSIQTQVLAADNRCLAESYYQLGVAYSYSDDFENSVKGFEDAVMVIESRIRNLEKVIEEKKSWTEEQKRKDAAEKKDPFYTESGEIEELNQLMPEIKEKIEDMQQMKKDSKEKIQKALKDSGLAAALSGAMNGTAASQSPSASEGASTSKAAAGSSSKSPVGAGSSGSSDANAFGSSDKPTSSKPVSNISHLIRKKRKPEEEAENAGEKKLRAEDGAVAKTNGSTEKKESADGEKKATKA